MSGSLDRYGRLEATLAANEAAAALVTDLPSVRYLSGFTGSSGVLWMESGALPTLITDFRYEEQATSEVRSPTGVHIAAKGWISALPEVAGPGERTVAFDPEHMTVADLEKVLEALPACELRPSVGLVSHARRVKDDLELAAIESAVRVAEEALRGTLGRIAWDEGPSERQVASRLEFELRAAGSETLPFEVIVASGPRTALPHATPSDREVASGDLVLIDFGARVDGYCSDITRTFVAGPASDEQRELHGRVLEAQRLAIEAVGPGVPCAEVDAAARDELSRHGWDRHFGHSTGHGIGLEIHEGPSLSTRSEEDLAPGNVVTVEPGVYLPDRGGVRIEDDVWVGEGGSRRLTSLPRDLIQL